MIDWYRDGYPNIQYIPLSHSIPFLIKEQIIVESFFLDQESDITNRPSFCVLHQFPG